MQNMTFPFRGVDLLSDLYGYGFKAEITGTPSSAVIPETVGGLNLPSDSQLIELELDFATAVNLRDGTTYVIDDNLRPGGHYNGQVLTFITGDAKGLSTRIYDYTLELDFSSTPATVVSRKFIVVAPKWNDGGTITIASLAGAQVVVNGREYSGFGAGGYTDSAETAVGLGVEGLEPNRVGEDLATISAGYLADDNGPNESYDAPDFQNPFLSGVDSSGTNPIASFHRESLVNHFGGTRTAAVGAGHMFSAFDLTAPGGVVDYPVDADNDGQADSIWIDPGYPVQSNGQGLYFKPLVAYKIVDLDSRLNLNALGNRIDMERVVAGSAAPDFPGQGFGVADVTFENFLTAAEYQALLQGDTVGLQSFPGRYGLGADGLVDTADEVPGGPGRDDWSTKKTFGFPTGTNTVERLFQTMPLDIRGRFSIASPATSSYADPNLGAAFNNALPEMDISLSVAGDGLSNSPYEMNFAPSPFKRWDTSDDDLPIVAGELERLLRPFDIDTSTLPRRLAMLLPNASADPVLRNQVTSDSFEIPISGLRVVNDASREPFGILDILRYRIVNEGDATSNPTYFGREEYEVDNYVRQLVPPEIFRGMKMNLNRPFGNGLAPGGGSNFVVDDPDETNEVNLDDAVHGSSMDLNNDFQAGTNDQLARFQYARYLYILLLLAGEDNVQGIPGVTDDEAYRTMLAQWAINVVDFRDPDSINTPFEFDINPFNGWDSGADGVLNVGEASTGTTGERRLVWGAERPELLISETFAHHDRALEDLAVGGTSTDATPDDWDSRLVPRTSAFIELYHPWSQSTNQQILPPELARTESAPTGVDLQKTTPTNLNPVWRIAVKRTQADMNFMRAIYFVTLGTNAGDPTDPGDITEAFYPSSSFGRTAVVTPGVHAVVGSLGTSVRDVGGDPGYRTTFGRLTTTLEGDDSTFDDIRSISLVPDANLVARYEWDVTSSTMVETTTSAIPLVIDSPRSLSLSDPDGGYPVDATVNPGSDVGDGYGYTTPVDEPLDVTLGDAADLPAIFNNGTTDGFRVVYLQRLANPLRDWNQETNPYITIDVANVDLLAFNGLTNDPQNQQTNNEYSSGGIPVAVTDGNTVVASTERGESQTNDKLLFRRDFGNNATADVTFPGFVSGSDLHHFSYVFEDSFGQTNDEYVADTAPYYAWLTWYNRPYLNQYELTNVPHVSQEDLTAFFDVDDATDNYDRSPTVEAEAVSSDFAHLPNFYGFSNTAAPDHGNLFRLFDFVEVPSMFTGTEDWANPTDFVNSPFGYFSNYRYPGKVNLNTIQGNVFNQVLGDYSTASLTYGDFDDSRFQLVGGAEFFRPYRNTAEANFVPLAGLVEDNVDLGLMRRDAGTANCLFDHDDTTANRDTSRNAYFRNAMRQRLGNLVTTKSSVFAIWVTVGFFEVNPDGTLKNVAGGGIEIGADTGEARRHRGFFIFDRSIPVAFEPGKNHNIDRAILIKSIIE